ncbi:MAG: glycosyltransferase family 1 protein [Candidatus Brachytrichaceae bacterium NZ_4S206]|jgi:glycosyltransferase involved in cell wall biosynthesis
MHHSSSHRIGFISTRFAGTDGVSLETSKWAHVLEAMGHTCYYFAGQCDRPPERSRVVPEAFYRHPIIDEINKIAFQGDWPSQPHPEIAGLFKDHFSIYTRPPSISRRVQELKDYFKQHLYDFVRDFELELLIVENALAIPVNLPLGLAITELIAETGFPTIAHHHDFAWERQRFIVNSVGDYIAAAFPPRLPSIRHVVINSMQASELGRRAGVTSRIIPNVMDFDHPPEIGNGYTDTLRADLGFRDGEYFFLQPTRIIQRKGIEHAIELTKRIGLPAKLVISHASGDEGTEYERRVREYAALLGVDVCFEADIIGEHRGLTPDGRKIYALADLYPHADLVTYPSAIEGFGNAFLEALYFRRPILVNNYSIYEVDIKPKGFKVIEFDGFISESTLHRVRQILFDEALVEEWAEHNYRLAQRYFSFSVLRLRLEALLADCFGYQV